MNQVAQGQKVALGVFAALFAVATLACVGFAAFMPDESDYTRVDVDALSGQAAGSRVRFVATLDPRAGASVGGILDGGWAIGIREDERIALYCAAQCPHEGVIEDALEQGEAFVGEPREFYATVEASEVANLSADERRSFAEEQLDVAAGQAVFVRLDQRLEPARAVFFVSAAWGFFGLLLTLGTLAFHASLEAREVEPERPSDRKERSPWLVLGLALLTLGLYNLYWRYRTTAALRRVTREASLFPALDVALVVVSIGVWPLYADARNGGILDRERLPSEGYQTTAIVMNVLGGLLGSCLSCYGLSFATPALLQSGYNELFMRRTPNLRQAREIFGDPSSIPPPPPSVGSG